MIDWLIWNCITILCTVYYCIIILCFSYLATWLPFLNKPIDWLIDWYKNFGKFNTIRNAVCNCPLHETIRKLTARNVAIHCWEHITSANAFLQFGRGIIWATLVWPIPAFDMSRRLHATVSTQSCERCPLANYAVYKMFSTLTCASINRLRPTRYSRFVPVCQPRGPTMTGSTCRCRLLSLPPKHWSPSA